MSVLVRAPSTGDVMLPLSQEVQLEVYSLIAISRCRDALVLRCASARTLVSLII